MKALFPIIYCAVVFIATNAWCADPKPKGQIKLDSGTKKILKKLNEIVLPVFDPPTADVAEVFQWLTEESKRLDSEKVGVNFVLKADVSGRQIRNVRLRYVKLIDILKVLTELVDLRYVIEPDCVVIVKRDNFYGVELETRIYATSPKFMRDFIRPVDSTPPDGIDKAQWEQFLVSTHGPATPKEVPSTPTGVGLAIMRDPNFLLLTGTSKKLEEFERLLHGLSARNEWKRVELSGLKRDPQFSRQLEPLKKKIQELEELKKKAIRGNP